MKRKLMVATLAISASLTAHAQFNTVNTAAYNSSSASIDLVPGACGGGHVNGAAWSTVTVDFTKNFRLEYNAKMTITDGSGTGADGHVVVFGNNINTTAGSGSIGGTNGGHIGYYTNTVDFNKSIGIEFDVFDNGATMGDITADHVMISKNANPATTVASAVPIDPGGANIEDGTYHNYIIEWSCEDRKLRVYWDGNLRINANFVPSTVFTTSSSVKWGFTSARQVFCNTENIKDILLQQSDQCGSCVHANMTMSGSCNGGTYDVGFGLGYAPEPDVSVVGMKLDFGDGTTATYLPPFLSPLHPYSPGLYTITYTVYGFNIKTGECCNETITAYLIVPKCGDGEGLLKKSKSTSVNTMNNASARVHIYPNPTTGEIDIDMKGEKFQNIVVTDMTGKVVFNQSYSSEANAKVNLKNMTDGVYVIKITDMQGNQTTDKIIVSAK